MQEKKGLVWKLHISFLLKTHWLDWSHDPSQAQGVSGRWRAASIRFPESVITFPNSGVILTELKVLDWPKYSLRLFHNLVQENLSELLGQSNKRWNGVTIVLNSMELMCL